MRLSSALFALLLLLPPIASSPLAPPPTSASTSTSTSISLPRPSCLSGNGSRVDWWFALKHPRGDNYSYLDSREGGEAARQGLASATEGPLARTLLQLYAPPPLPWRVLWNDQPPFPSREEGEEERDEDAHPLSFAHSKGVLAMAAAGGGGGGFFLSHSAPRFPSDPATGGGYSGLPLPQQRFSQHFLCVSLAGSGMEALTRHLSRAFRPRAFSLLLPAEEGRARSSSSPFEAAAAFAAGALPLAPTSSSEVATAAGEDLLLLATAGGAGEGGGSSSPAPSPLWDTVVASAAAAAAADSTSASSSSSPSPSGDRRLPPPLAVQSWIRTEGAAPPKCRVPLPPATGDEPLPLPSVLGVRRVSFGGEKRRAGGGRGRSGWASEDAHAKWAVVLGRELIFSCVGDTNRDAPGGAGGAACVRWPGLRRALASAVEEVDACESDLARE